MPKINKPKTYADFKSAKPKSKAYRISGGNSLFLCILPSGKKRWQFDYTFQGELKVG